MTAIDIVSIINASNGNVVAFIAPSTLAFGMAFDVDFVAFIWICGGYFGGKHCRDRLFRQGIRYCHHRGFFYVLRGQYLTFGLF